MLYGASFGAKAQGQTAQGQKGQELATQKQVMASKTFVNPIGPGADPWITFHNGKYYTCKSAGRSIVVTESRFMTRPERTEVVWHAPKEGWNAFNVWAPELHFVRGKWYIYYAAAPKHGTPYFRQRAGSLECNTPLGQYTDKGIMNAGDDPDDPSTNVWGIDMSVFEHKGQLYAVWSGWEKQRDNAQTAQHTYIAPMRNPYTLGKRVLISKADQPWELGEMFGLQEGQAALKNGKDLFIMYSTRGSWTHYYRIGYLKLTRGADPLKPESWTKSPGPVFQGTETIHGVGHASYTKSPDGKQNWIFYHTKKTKSHNWDRNVRLQQFTFDAHGNPYFGEPQEPGVMDRPSGEYEIELGIKKAKKKF